MALPVVRVVGVGAVAVVGAPGVPLRQLLSPVPTMVIPGLHIIRILPFP